MADADRPAHQPLRARSRVLAGGDDAGAAWEALVEKPIGEAITSCFSSDLVRGVVATDALIGTFADLGDESLRQNVCFLYHLLGGGVGIWDVPDRRHGRGDGALADAARGFGADILTGAEVLSVSPDGEFGIGLGTTSIGLPPVLCSPMSRRLCWRV